MVKNTFLHSCRQIIYSLLLLFMASMFVISLFLTVHVNAVDGSTELISYTAPSLVGSLAAIVIFIIFHRLSVKLLERMPILPGSAAMLILWGLCAFAFIAATNLSQMYDYQYVLEIGKLFGQSRFSAMHSEYLNAYPFQLGICLFIEFLSRCFPSFDTGLLLQLLNVASCLVASGALCAISYFLWKQDGLRSCVTLCATSVPVLLFCIYVYGTLYMTAVLLLIFLCFILYCRTSKNLYLVFCIVLFPVAYTFKLNAAVPLIAFSICCLFITIEQKKAFPLFSAVLAVMITLGVNSAVRWQYELRSGNTIQSTVSTKARFIMGFQDGDPAFGWHNRYIEKYFPLDMRQEERTSMENEDFQQMLDDLMASPVKTAGNFFEKITTQWLEPSYETIRYLQTCEAKGPYPYIANEIANPSSALSRVIQFILKAEQQLLYLASSVYLFFCIRKKEHSLLIFALTIGGGVLYHFLFEAKSAYAMVYMIFAVLFASKGILIIEDALSAFISSKFRIVH